MPHHREEETDNQHESRPSNARSNFDSVDYEVAPSVPEEEVSLENNVKKIDQEELDKAIKASMPTETTSQPQNG